MSSQFIILIRLSFHSWASHCWISSFFFSLQALLYHKIIVIALGNELPSRFSQRHSYYSWAYSLFSIAVIKALIYLFWITILLGKPKSESMARTWRQELKEVETMEECCLLTWSSGICSLLPCTPRTTSPGMVVLTVSWALARLLAIKKFPTVWQRIFPIEVPLPK